MSHLIWFATVCRLCSTVGSAEKPVWVKAKLRRGSGLCLADRVGLLTMRPSLYHIHINMGNLRIMLENLGHLKSHARFKSYEQLIYIWQGIISSTHSFACIGQTKTFALSRGNVWYHLGNIIYHDMLLSCLITARKEEKERTNRKKDRETYSGLLLWFTADDNIQASWEKPLLSIFIWGPEYVKCSSLSFAVVVVVGFICCSWCV